MTVASYQYQSDNGITYQVVLPTDFAASLGYAAATGSEAYLPDSISPRYCTYISAFSKLVQNIVFPNKSFFPSPPGTLSFGGIVYSFRSAIGEQNIAVPIGNIVTISGPQGPIGPTGATGATGPTGPTGPPGSSLSYTSNLGSDQALTSGSQTTVITSATVATGNYVVDAHLSILTGAANGLVDVSLKNNNLGTIFASTTVLAGSNSQWYNVAITGATTFSSPGTVTLQCKAAMASANAKATNHNGDAGGCHLNVVQVGS